MYMYIYIYIYTVTITSVSCPPAITFRLWKPNCKTRRRCQTEPPTLPFAKCLDLCVLRWCVTFFTHSKSPWKKKTPFGDNNRSFFPTPDAWWCQENIPYRPYPGNTSILGNFLDSMHRISSWPPIKETSPSWPVSSILFGCFVLEP